MVVRYHSVVKLQQTNVGPCVFVMYVGLRVHAYSRQIIYIGLIFRLLLVLFYCASPKSGEKRRATLKISVIA